LVKDKKKVKEKLIQFGEGLRKVATVAATHPATFGIMAMLGIKTAAIINQAAAMKNEGGYGGKHWRTRANDQIDKTLGNLSNNVMTMTLAVAAVPVVVAGLGVAKEAFEAYKTRPVEVEVETGYP